MNWGLITYKDIAEFCSYILTSLSLLGIAVAYLQSRKQIHFSTMEKCLNDYRMFLKLKDNDMSANEIAEQYIDLVNEEFFYFENKYLPEKVCIEWVDGMIDYLPFFTHKFVKSRKLISFSEAQDTLQVLYDYPRVIKAITLKNNIDFDKIYLSPLNDEDRNIRRVERDKLIFEIISNVVSQNRISSYRLKKLLKKR